MSNNNTRRRADKLLQRFKYGLTTEALAEALQVKKHWLGSVLRRMVADGQIRKTSDKEGRYVLCGAVPREGVDMTRGAGKVKITVETDSGTRSYEGNYGFAATADNTDGVTCRWYQEPSRWENGLGLFLVGVETLKVVAEQEGNATFQLAARAALDAMRSYEPKEKT